LFAVIALGLAILVALYTKAGTRPVTILGWEYSAQPSFLVLSLSSGLLLTAGVARWLAKQKQPSK
jgi:hypothetical protein